MKQAVPDRWSTPMPGRAPGIVQLPPPLVHPGLPPAIAPAPAPAPKGGANPLIVATLATATGVAGAVVALVLVVVFGAALGPDDRAGSSAGLPGGRDPRCSRGQPGATEGDVDRDARRGRLRRRHAARSAHAPGRRPRRRRDRGSGRVRAARRPRGDIADGQPRPAPHRRHEGARAGARCGHRILRTTAPRG